MAAERRYENEMFAAEQFLQDAGERIDMLQERLFRELTKRLTSTPPTFDVHEQVQRMLDGLAPIEIRQVAAEYIVTQIYWLPTTFEVRLAVFDELGFVVPIIREEKSR